MIGDLQRSTQIRSRRARTATAKKFVMAKGVTLSASGNLNLKPPYEDSDDEEVCYGPAAKANNRISERRPAKLNPDPKPRHKDSDKVIHVGSSPVAQNKPATHNKPAT